MHVWVTSEVAERILLLSWISKPRMLLANALLAIATCLALALFAFLDFDPHHDGVMLAPAIAVSEGKAVFSEVFSQYGPVSHWIHAAWLGIWPWGAAAGLRAFNVLAIGLTVFLVADVARVAPPAWGLHPKVFFVLGLVWALANDVFFGVPMLPWSSVVASAMLVSIAYLIARGIAQATNRGFSWHLFLSGFLSGVLPFTRQTVGVVLALLLVLAAFLFLAGRGLDRRVWVSSTFGCFAGVALLFGALFLDGSLFAWFSQSVVWPWSWVHQVTEAGGQFAGFDGLISIMVAMAVAVFFVVFRLSRFSPLFRIMAAVLVVAVLFGFPDPSSGLFVAHEFVEAGSNSLISQGLAVSYRALFAIFSTCLVLLIWSLVLTFIGALRFGHSSFIGPRVLFIAIFFASLSQVFPVTDSRHVWWALGPMLLLVGHFLSSDRLESAFSAWFPGLITWIVALTITAGANLFLVDRSQYPDQSVAAGMFGREEGVERMRVELDFLARSNDGSNTVFLVVDGHLSVLKGQYVSLDEFFVGWGPVSPLNTRLLNQTEIIVDRSFLPKLRGTPYRIVDVSDDGGLYRVLLN